MRPSSPSLPGVPAVLLVVGALGCGHPATREECETIFKRSAELALKTQNVTDPAAVARAVEEARAAKGQAMTDDCVGKRVTDEVMRCIKDAQTTAEFDRCTE